MLKLSLEGIGAPMARVSVTEEKISEARERLPLYIVFGGQTISIIFRVTWVYAIANRGSKWNVTGLNLVQVLPRNQSAQCASQI